MIIRLPTNCETQGGKKRARPHWPRPLFYIVHFSFCIDQFRTQRIEKPSSLP